MDASFKLFDVSMVISLGKFIPGIPGKSLEFCNFFSRAVKTPQKVSIAHLPGKMPGIFYCLAAGGLVCVRLTVQG